VKRWLKNIVRPERHSRRAFLRGATGAALALPFMEALAPRIARGAEPGIQRRLLYWYTPNGHNMDDWYPANTGPGYTLSPILEPLAPYRSDLTVVSGLWNYGCQVGEGGHEGSAGAFLTCAELVKDTVYNATSIDQIAAGHIADGTVFPSLELGMESGSNPNGYGANISWSSPETPRPKVTSPSALYSRLFDSGSLTLSPEEVERRRGLRLSVLDALVNEVNALSPRLPQRDRLKLDEYTTSIRELELRIAALSDSSCEPGDPTGDGDDFIERLELMNALMVKAFECDLTRVLSFMLGTAASNREYSWIGIDEWHHGLSHHAFDSPTLAKLTEIGRWQSQHFGGFLQLLKDTPDLDGRTLFDNTVILYGSGMSDGHYHLNEDLPLIVAGCPDHFAHGQHVRAEEKPLANLHIALCQAVGVDVPSFGVAGDGPLAGLT